MPENRLPNRPRAKPTEPWRIERMVQRVPGHLGEEPAFSPWLVVGAVAVIVIVGCAFLFFSGFPSGLASPNDQPTRTPRPTTIIVLTATPVLTKTPTPAPTAVIAKYTVKKGDTLSSIAQKYKVTVEAIRAANNLTDDTIHVGDILTIPLPAPTPQALAGPTGVPTDTPLAFTTPTLIVFAQTSSSSAQPTTPTPTPGVVVYTVRPGDTLISIAAIYSTTVQAIIDLNLLPGPQIRAGQALSIPVGAWTATPTATVFVQPTATSTPQFSHAAPVLLNPGDGDDIARDSSVTFQWTSAGTLTSDEYYVLHLRYTIGDEERNAAFPISEGTSYKMDVSPAGNLGPTEFFWYVVVVRGNGCGPISPAAVQPCAVSPLSETRSFTWR